MTTTTTNTPGSVPGSVQRTDDPNIPHVGLDPVWWTHGQAACAV